MASAWAQPVDPQVAEGDQDFAVGGSDMLAQRFERVDRQPVVRGRMQVGAVDGEAKHPPLRVVGQDVGA